MSFAQVELQVIRWAEARKILPNATSQTQLIKAFSEIGECGDELIKGNKEKMKMELGDTIVSLIIFSAIEDIDLTECTKMAYNKIKDRTGTMMPNGVFIKSN